MSKDILRADPRLRRIVWIVVASVAVLGVVVLFAFSRWLGDAAINMHPAELVPRMRSLIGVTLTGSAVCLAALALHAARSARRTLEMRQWPAPGVRVIRDTPMRRGDAAVRIARMLQAVSGLLVLLAIATGVVSWRLFALT